VVVGASAGGIEALSTLVSTLPTGFPAPIVLAQHLDPHHPSHLGEILARYTPLPVQTVTDEAPLEDGIIYVIPADRNVEVADHVLRLRANGVGLRPKPSINLLFSSAAAAYGEQLIAVILTGTGSDGASGAYQVKAAGGVVIIENPQTAAYPALPASLAPTTVDFVADLGRIGPLLSELLTGLPLHPEGSVDAHHQAAEVQQQEDEARERALRTVLALVREHSNIDFSQYKTPTILRRLQRRMVATEAADLPAYLRYLESHPEEYQRLVSSFLIKVTEFFRDPDLVAELQQQVLPDLIAEGRKRGNLLRIWSAGCATGEEAYSLAILVSEALEDELDGFTVQIFATDVDEDAIEFARHGIYPPAAMSGVSQERLARYFLRLNGNFQITKALRGLVIFGVHDLGLRAPFPHIDLVVCRNVLMYFTRELQARALQLFAFSLRNGGYLALGTAETVSPLAAFFEQLTPERKLFRRRGEHILAPLPTVESLQELVTNLPRQRQHALVRTGEHGHAALPPAALAKAMVLQRAQTTNERLGALVMGLPLGVVVVDRRYDIQMINGAAMRLLGLYTEAVGEDLIHLAQTVPSAALRAVIDAALRGGREPTDPFEPSEVLPLPVAPPVAPGEPREPRDHLESVVTVETLLGEQRHLELTCYPYPQPARAPAAAKQEVPAGQRQAADVPLVLIVIRDVTEAARRQEQASVAAAGERADSAAAATRRQTEIEAIVQRVQEENTRLKAEIERQSDINRALLEGDQKLAEVNLALRASNENLQLSAEEAEASAEEVKTLNEELQATNEELVTVNEELEATVEELHASNAELEARTRELQQLAATVEAQQRQNPSA
jgi:two-component system CheB/CheR fusion protein